MNKELKWVNGIHGSYYLCLGKQRLGSISWGMVNGEDYVAYNIVGVKKAGFRELIDAQQYVEDQAKAYANLLHNVFASYKGIKSKEIK